MRKRELERFERMLRERREQLLEQSARLSGEGRNTISEGGDDYVDDAVTHYTREFLLSLSDLDRRQLLMVEEALGRIRDGEYGECVMCGSAIGIKRLGAVPWARFCVSCQELAEKQELAGLSPLREFSEEEEVEQEDTGTRGGEEE
jgi:DnaK suppressor protein